MRRHVYLAPKQPGAEPVCLLTKEWAQQRQESPEAFLQLVQSEEALVTGTLYHFPPGEAVWERLQVFMREEGECCPFFAFEAEQDEDETRLRVLWPQHEVIDNA